MLRSTRPSSQSYQVAAVWGAPAGLTVATTAGFGRARKASISDGTGTRGTPPSLLRREQVGPQVGLGKPCAENVPVRVARTVREQLAGLGDEGVDTEFPRPLDSHGEEGALRALSAVFLERSRCAEPAHAVVNGQRASRHRLAPSEARIPHSRCRAVARTSRRLATLAQPRSRKRRAAAIRILAATR